MKTLSLLSCRRGDQFQYKIWIIQICGFTFHMEPRFIITGKSNSSYSCLVACGDIWSKQRAYILLTRAQLVPYSTNQSKNKVYEVLMKIQGYKSHTWYTQILDIWCEIYNWNIKYWQSEGVFYITKYAYTSYLIKHLKIKG